MTWNDIQGRRDPAFSSDPRAHPHFPLPFTRTRTRPPPPPPLKNSIPVPLQNTLIPRKASMKALVRRLTSRHNLDRIDELDESDPFGSSYHHGGPYEAIDASHVQPIQTDTVPRRPNIHHSNHEVCQASASALIRPSRSWYPSSSFRVPCIPRNTK